MNSSKSEPIAQAKSSIDVFKENIASSSYGKAFRDYQYFLPNMSFDSKVKDNKLILFAEYDVPKILEKSCSQSSLSSKQLNELKKIQKMMVSCSFSMKESVVIPYNIAWSLKCNNGTHKEFQDAELNTLKEIMNNKWYSDCPSLLEIASKGCAP